MDVLDDPTEHSLIRSHRNHKRFLKGALSFEKEGCMGKAAVRAGRKRLKYLRHLALRNPDKFDMEWEKRMASWIITIHKVAGVLRNDRGERVRAVFSIVEEALTILSQCGTETFRKLAVHTQSTLDAECCRALSLKISPALYKLRSLPGP